MADRISLRTDLDIRIYPSSSILELNKPENLESFSKKQEATPGGPPSPSQAPNPPPAQPLGFQSPGPVFAQQPAGAPSLTPQFNSTDNYPSISPESSPSLVGAGDPSLEIAGSPTLRGADDPDLERSSGTPTLRGAGEPNLEIGGGSPTLGGAGDPALERGTAGSPSLIGASSPTLERAGPAFSPFSTLDRAMGPQSRGRNVGYNPFAGAATSGPELTYVSEEGVTINLNIPSLTFVSQEGLSIAAPIDNSVARTDLGINYSTIGASIQGANLFLADGVITNTYAGTVPPYAPGLDISASYPDTFPNGAFAIYEANWAITGTGGWDGIQVKTWLDSSGNDNHLERTGSTGDVDWNVADSKYNLSHSVQFNRVDWLSREVFQQGNDADIRTILFLASFDNAASPTAEVLMDGINTSDERYVSFSSPYDQLFVGDGAAYASILSSSGAAFSFGSGEVLPLLFTLSGAALDTSTFQLTVYAGNDWYTPMSESAVNQTVGGMDGILVGKGANLLTKDEFSGSIAMISMWDRVLDNQEIMTAATYLNTKYGTTITFTASVAATSSWRPIDLTGGIFYWDPDLHVTASGQSLTSIPDLITGGVGRNLEAYSYNPTYHATDNFFSGRAAVQFSSSQQQELLLSSLGGGFPQQFTIWTLVRYDAATNLQRHFNNEYSGDFDVEIDLIASPGLDEWTMYAGNQPLTGSDTQIGTVDTGSMYLVVGVYNGASSFLYANGVDRDLFPNSPGTYGPDDVGGANSWVGINGDFTMTAMGILEQGITAADHQNLLTWSVEQCGNSL